MSSDIMDGLELVGPRSSSDVKDQSKGRRNSISFESSEAFSAGSEFDSNLSQT